MSIARRRNDGAVFQWLRDSRQSAKLRPRKYVTIDSHRPAASQGRITAEYVAALALAESATLAEAATGVLRAMCEALGWDYGALWNTDRRERAPALREHLASAHRHVPDFEAATRRTDLHTRRRSPGPCLGQRRARRGFPTSAADANFPRADDRQARRAARRIRAAPADPGPGGRRHGVLQSRDPRARRRPACGC